MNKTCENCIHCDCCDYWEEEAYPNDAEKYHGYICNEFCDKSKFIELPCKAGDKIYLLSYRYILQYKVLSIEIDECGITIVAYCIGGDSCYPDRFGMKQIGKTVFLTKEEAEKRLEEIKSNA